MSDIRCDIRQKLGVLSENERGYTKEANVISWNDGPQKLDLREWSPEHRARKGISFALQQPVRFKGITVKDLLSLAAGKNASVADASE